MKTNYREIHAFEDDNQPKDFRGLDLCVCGLPKDSHYHTPLLKEDAQPSAQTEWEKSWMEFCVKFRGKEKGVDALCIQGTEFIRELLVSERTRLLSVESMKMEKVNLNDPDWLKYGKERSNIVRRDLRQSILSEMEKGK